MNSSSQIVLSPKGRQDVSDRDSLPLDWETVTLGDICTISIGRTPSRTSRESWGKGHTWLSIRDLSSKVVASSKEEITDFGASGIQVVPKGTLLMSFKLSVGRLAIAGKDLYTNEAICAFRDLRVDRDFLYHALRNTDFSLYGEQAVKGATLNKSSLASVRISLPKSLVEQEAIAKCLNSLDDLEEAQKSLLNKKSQAKRALMQRLLTGEMRLPGFSEDWKEGALGDCLEKIVGGGTPSRANPAFWGGNIPWVTVKDFATFNPSKSQEYITQDGLHGSASQLIPAGTLVTSTRMALGKAVVYEVDIAINQDLKALFFNEDHSVRFARFWFEQNADRIDRLGSGSTVKGISVSELRGLSYPLVSRKEQEEIASLLASFEVELGTLAANLAKTQKVKQALMDNLLTGKLRLPSS